MADALHQPQASAELRDRRETFHSLALLHCAGSAVAMVVGFVVTA